MRLSNSYEMSKRITGDIVRGSKGNLETVVLEGIMLQHSVSFLLFFFTKFFVFFKFFFESFFDKKIIFKLFLIIFNYFYLFI